MEAHGKCFKTLPPGKKKYQISSEVVQILQAASKLSNDDYHALCCELLKRSPCSNDNLRTEMNYARDLITWRNKHPERKQQAAVSSGRVCGHRSNDDPGAFQTEKEVGDLGRACGHRRTDDPGAFQVGKEVDPGRACGHQSNDDPGAFQVGKEVDPGRACGHQSNDDPGASKTFQAPENDSAPASKVSLICRGDLIKKQKKFYVDTEKVTEAGTHENLSGDLAIVDDKGRVVFWCFIKREKICKFNTSLTGLTKAKIQMGLEITTIQDLLNRMFQDKILVGAALVNDLRSLGMKLEDCTFSIEDIQDFYRDSKNQPISLAYLGEHFLGENVQGETHSSIQDARFTALCDRKKTNFQRI